MNERLFRTFGNLGLPLLVADSLSNLDIAYIAPDDSGHVTRLLDRLATLDVLERTDDEYGYKLKGQWEEQLRNHKFKAAAERYAKEHAGVVIEMED